MFDGKVEITKAYKNIIVMTGVEEEILFNLEGTFSHALMFLENQ
jgi:hypothetical protein